MTNDFSIIKEVINVKVPDVGAFEVSVPSVGESKRFSNELRDADPSVAVEKVQGFLVELGLPLQIQEEHFTVSNLLDLWAVVNGSKKK